MALEKILKFLRSNSFDKKLIIIRQTWRVFNRPGVTVGDFCVIGANNVVGHDIPDYSIAYGNPAKVVRKRIL